MTDSGRRMRYTRQDLDGTGSRRTRTYPLAAVAGDYWGAVTDVPCPVCPCGILRWAEAGYVPGYRICDGCGRHYLAAGDHAQPVVYRVRRRRSLTGQVGA